MKTASSYNMLEPHCGLVVLPSSLPACTGTSTASLLVVEGPTGSGCSAGRFGHLVDPDRRYPKVQTTKYQVQFEAGCGVW